MEETEQNPWAGIRFVPGSGRFSALVGDGRNTICIGSFPTLKQAVAVRKAYFTRTESTEEKLSD